MVVGVVRLGGGDDGEVVEEMSSGGGEDGDVEV